MHTTVQVQVVVAAEGNSAHLRIEGTITESIMEVVETHHIRVSEADQGAVNASVAAQDQQAHTDVEEATEANTVDRDQEAQLG